MVHLLQGLRSGNGYYFDAFLTSRISFEKNILGKGSLKASLRKSPLPKNRKVIKSKKSEDSGLRSFLENIFVDIFVKTKSKALSGTNPWSPSHVQILSTFFTGVNDVSRCKDILCRSGKRRLSFEGSGPENSHDLLRRSPMVSFSSSSIFSKFDLCCVIMQEMCMCDLLFVIKHALPSLFSVEKKEVEPLRISQVSLNRIMLGG